MDRERGGRPTPLRASPALVASAIFVATLASRLPFVTRSLWEWDSVLYARALERGFHVGFDLAQQRPHPPGYIFYVAAAQAARAFLGDTNAALVLVSVLASAASAALLYLFALRFARRAIALVVALAYAADPLVWTHGEVAVPYALLGLLSIAAAWLIRARAPGLGSAAAFGAVAGFRQDLLAVLGPLWLRSLGGASWAGRAAAVAGLLLGSLAWALPTAALSDGPIPYASALTRQVVSVSASSSVAAQGLSALWLDLRFAALALGWGLFALLPLVALAGAHAAGRLRRGVRPPTETQMFFALWILPGLAVLVLVHFGEWGQVLSILPAMYVALASAAERMARDLPPLPRPLALAAAIAVVAPPALAFALGAGTFSAAALAHHDRALAARVQYVRAAFPPATTLVLARSEYLLVRHYLPEYRARLYDPRPPTAGDVTRMPTAGLRAVVLFGGDVHPRQRLDVTEVDLGEGARIAYARLGPGSALELYGAGHGVREP